MLLFSVSVSFICLCRPVSVKIDGALSLLLHSDDGFNVMVWIGHGASASERKQALNYGIAYLVKYNRPLTTPLSRYLEGGETKVAI